MCSCLECTTERENEALSEAQRNGDCLAPFGVPCSCYYCTMNERDRKNG